MATWKKVIVSGSTANLAALQVDNLTSGQVVIGGGTGNLSSTAVNGTGNIVATTNATNLIHSGSFSGSFQGNFVGTTNLPDLTQGTGITAFTYDGAATATVAVSGASALSTNNVTKWTGTAFANSSLTDNGTTITGATSLQLTGANSALTGSFTGSFVGNGAGLTGVTATAIFPTTAVTNVTSTDKFFISQSTGQEYITYGNLLTDLAGTNLTVEGSDSLTLASQISVTGVTASLFGTSSWATNATNATNAANVAVTDTTTGTGPYYIMFADGTTGNRAVRVDSAALTFNATTNTLTVTSSNAISSSFASTVGSIASNVTNNTDNYILTATGGGSINGESNLQFNGSTLTVTGNTVITNNLTVQGTASFQQTTNLEVADRFVLFASGSNTAGDGGIVVQQATQNVGELYGYENSINRWGFTSSFSANSPSFTAAAYVTTTEVSAGAPSAAPIYGGASNGFGNIHVNTVTGDIFIYS
jgi:hypothetical protein